MEPKVRKLKYHRPRIRQKVWDQVVAMAEEEGINPNRLIEEGMLDWMKAIKEAMREEEYRKAHGIKGLEPTVKIKGID